MARCRLFAFEKRSFIEINLLWPTLLLFVEVLLGWSSASSNSNTGYWHIAAVQDSLHRHNRSDMTMRNRKNDLISFYQLLDQLEQKAGGRRLLSDCNVKTIWPLRGVYFFMEPGEVRTDSGLGHRVVRVGTHGLKAGSKATLWKRLSQHKGVVSSGGGNHRGSIFRLLVGTTLLENHSGCSTWGKGSTAKGDVRLQEEPIEQAVSEIIRKMPFLYLSIDDATGRDSLRGVIERNSIALLSNFQKPLLDSPSQKWIGHRCNREKVRLSGIWNQDHVDEVYDPNFLKTLETLINHMGNAA